MLWVFKRVRAINYRTGFVDVPDVQAAQMIAANQANSVYDYRLIPEPDPSGGMAPAPTDADESESETETAESAESERTRRGPGRPRKHAAE